jgi:hypothetical protein
LLTANSNGHTASTWEETRMRAISVLLLIGIVVDVAAGVASHRR